MRIVIEASGFYTYPDVSVAFDPRFADECSDVLLNPTLIVGVLSPSTERYDRGEQVAEYRMIRSLIAKGMPAGGTGRG